MTYNTTTRRRFTADQRRAFLILHGCICYWCRQPIAEGQPFDIEHVIARELMAGKDADADENLRPIHAHPAPCHKAKTRIDRKLIAKSNRLQRARDPETRRKTRHPIRNAGRAIPSRPFNTKRKP